MIKSLKNKIKELLPTLKSRISNKLENSINKDCVICTDKLEIFLIDSAHMVSELLSIDLEKSVNEFSSLVVHGAVLSALSSQTLIECGREYPVNDNGVSFYPLPKVSQMLFNQWSNEYLYFMQKAEMIRTTLYRHA